MSSYYDYRNKIVSVEDFIGLKFEKIEISEDKEEISFLTVSGQEYKMLHFQDCCESVYVEDIVGSLDDLIGLPITNAYESSNHSEVGGYESATWTFYNFVTAKGYVTIRWCGESNGYYSENVDVIKVKGEI